MTALPGLLQPTAAPPPVAHRCDHPGCTAWYSHGFKPAGEPLRRFCAVHKADGEMLLGARRPDGRSPA